MSIQLENTPSGQRTDTAKEPVRRPVVVVVAILCLGLLGSAAWYFTHRPKNAETPQAAAAPASAADQQRKTPEATSSQKEMPPSVAAPGATPAAPLSSVPARAEAPRRPEVSPEMRQLVNNLLQIDFSKGPITAEQAAIWRNQLTNLVHAGAAAIPAIREFLEQNKDLAFDPKAGGTQLGSPTARMALLNALQQIGGPESLQLAYDTLKSTTQPREIAQLAQHLEADAPEQYRAAILDAVRESIAMARAGKLGNTDTGPLFGVLTRYGGEGAVGDLQNVAPSYRYYSALALADLPNGAGLAALTQMLRDPNGPPKSTHTPALEALSQMVPFYPEAAEKLLEQARLNQIPDTLWQNIAKALTGGKFYFCNPA